MLVDAKARELFGAGEHGGKSVDQVFLGGFLNGTGYVSRRDLRRARAS